MSIVITRSGNIRWLEQPQGCATPIPDEFKSPWLNDVIIKALQDIKALKDSGGGTGIAKSIIIAKAVIHEGEPPCIAWAYQDTPTQWNKIVDVSELKGDKGDQGEQGLIGPVGPVGPQGPQGQKGGSVHIKGSLDKPPSEPPKDPDDAWLVNGNLWVWDGHAWINVGHIEGPMGPTGPVGPMGPKGARGPQGPKGSQGSSGTVAMFVLQLMVNTAVSVAVNQAMSGVMLSINDAINDAINQAMSGLENQMMDAVKDTVKDAIDELGDLSGKDGEDGKDGKDGLACTIVGQVDSPGQLPFPSSSQAGKGYIVGAKKDLYICLEDIPNTNIWIWKDVGNIQGPKGEDAEWVISVRDEGFVEKAFMEVPSDLPPDVAGVYFQEGSGISLNPIEGHVDTVGFSIGMKTPIPKIIEEGHEGPGETATTGQVLSNDGKQLKWVDSGTSKGKCLLKSKNGYQVWELSVDDNGRLQLELSSDTTQTDKFILHDSTGKQYYLEVDAGGRLIVSEVV